MPWNAALAQWPHLIEQLCADFRFLERAALERFRGDRNKMVVYLAETHDLTFVEAEEALENWLRYVGSRFDPSVSSAVA